jgi:hypothetical protein
LPSAGRILHRRAEWALIENRQEAVENESVPQCFAKRCDFLLIFDIESIRTRRTGCLDRARWHKRRVAKVFLAGWKGIATFFGRWATSDKDPTTVTVGIVVANAKHPAFRSARREDLLKLVAGTNGRHGLGWGWWRLREGCRHQQQGDRERRNA